MITALVAHTSFLFVNKSLPARLVCSLASPEDDRFSPKLLTGGNCLIPPPFIFPCCKLCPEGIIQWILTSGRKHFGLPCSLKKHLLLRERWGERSWSTTPRDTRKAQESTNSSSAAKQNKSISLKNTSIFHFRCHTGQSPHSHWASTKKIILIKVTIPRQVTQSDRSYF